MRKLIQDSLRTNEWIAYWQSKKRTIAALSNEQLALLAEHDCGVEGNMTLKNFIQPGKEEQAVVYFEKQK